LRSFEKRADIYPAGKPISTKNTNTDDSRAPRLAGDKKPSVAKYNVKIVMINSWNPEPTKTARIRAKGGGRNTSP